MLAGATGTRIHPMKTVHALQSEQVAMGRGADPTTWSRPFDRDRTGHGAWRGRRRARARGTRACPRRGARIHGEVIGHGAGSQWTAAALATTVGGDSRPGDAERARREPA